MSALSLRGVRKAYGTTSVLSGVDLDIPAGSLTAVLGASGCGKTTLLRLIAGFIEPDAGTISFDGTEVAGPSGSVPARRRRVGYVPQEGSLFPHLSIADNITFGLPRAQRGPGPRLSALLALVGLDAEVATRFPDELSGGQQQRAALARALAPDPSVVLLDEPFSSLDAGLREGTGRAVARALRATGATAVLVTHDQGEALSLADQVAVMRDGQLVQVASPAGVYGRPADAGVATFVGGAVLLAGRRVGRQVSCVLGTLEVLDEPGLAAKGDADVQVLVRPEQIRLGAEGVPARVSEVSYYGHDSSVRLDLLGLLDREHISVLARVHGSDVPGRGGDTRLSVVGPVSVFATASVAAEVG